MVPDKIQAISLRHLTAEIGFDPRPVHVNFVTNKEALGRCYSESSRFLYQYQFTNAKHLCIRLSRQYTVLGIKSFFQWLKNYNNKFVREFDYSCRH